jgi:hypothetical protein
MQRAALVVVEDRDRIARDLAVGVRIDLLQNEVNGVGWYPGSRVVLDRDRTGLIAIQISLRGHDWVARPYGDGAVVEDSPLLNGGTRMLSDGDVVGWPALGIALRFERVDGRALEHRVAVAGGLLLDCTADPARVDGRWPALRSTPSGIERVLAVARRDAPLAFAAAADGASIRVLAERGPGFEPAVALAIAAKVARFFANRDPSTSPIEMPADCFVVGFDGAVLTVPPLLAQRPASDGFGVVVELLGRMLPDDAVVRLHEPASSIWRDLVHPWLDAIAAPHEHFATPPIAEVSALLDEAVRGSRVVDAAELASIARGLCPRSWERELELREELATIATLDDLA